MTSGSAKISDLHWGLIGVILSIAGLGIYNLHSAAAARHADLYLTQGAWFLVGSVLVAGLLLLDYRITESMAYIIYGIVCVLLLAVLVQGKTTNGSTRWLELGPLTFQPSELAKLATVLCLARYFSHRVRPDGYSLGLLFRPFNLSRPFVLLVAIALGWNNAWFVDPIGSFARLALRKGFAREPGDLLWFKVMVLSLLILGSAAALYSIWRRRTSAELLDPWPQSRVRAAVLAVGGTVAVAVLLLVWTWNAPLMRDPFGVILSSLARGAQAGGRYEHLDSGLALRLMMVMAASVYMLVSIMRLRRVSAESIDRLIAPIDLLVLPALLILVEPDLGTTGIVVLVGLTMILVVGVRFRSLMSMGFLGALMGIVAWFGVLKDYQKQRILTFIEPESDIQGSGWNAVQSMIAVGSGRWWGKGHLGGTQTQLSFLPEQHTDFAFSVWAEEQGFMGCALVLVLYFVLLAMAFSIAAAARDIYGTLVAVGVAAIILWQTLINVAMVAGMAPVVGLTLPMFSYGGSSLLTVLVGLGLLLNIHLRRH